MALHRGFIVIAVLSCLRALAANVGPNFPLTSQVLPQLCSVPVEVQQRGHSFLACADNANLKLCPNLRQGDRVVLEAGQCLVFRDQMPLSMRWLIHLKADLNQLSAAELSVIKGIGPKTAALIHRYQKNHDPLADMNTLLEIPGVGPKTLALLADYVYVGAKDNSGELISAH